MIIKAFVRIPGEYEFICYSPPRLGYAISRKLGDFLRGHIYYGGKLLKGKCYYFDAGVHYFFVKVVAALHQILLTHQQILSLVITGRNFTCDHQYSQQLQLSYFM